MKTRQRTLLALAGLAVFFTILALLLGALATSTNRQGSLNPLENLYLRIWLAQRESDLQTPAGTDDALRIFVITPGNTAAVIGDNLFAQGLISDSELFRNYVRYEGLDSQLEAGSYFLKPAMTLPEIARILTDSSAASVTIRILEGWRREEIAAAVDANPLAQFSGADFLAVTGPGAPIPPDFARSVDLPEGASLEGFLYPETYFVPPDAGAEDFRGILLETFTERAGQALQNASLQTGLTPYAIVTLASIVEREAVHPEEQPLIASVYINRLSIGMKLDADPTVQYGIGFRDGAWWPSITRADYQAAVSPYNTYLNAGLPPGPIASPSRSAIDAVISPAQTTYFYFRAECSGSGYHVFAETFEEHVANGNCSTQ